MKKNIAMPHTKKPQKPRAGIIPIIRSYRGAAGTLLLLHALLSVLLQITWVSIPDGFLNISKKGLDGYVIAAIFMQGICVLLPTLFVLFWFKMPANNAVGVSKSTPGGLLMSITIGIPAAVVFIGLNNGFLYFLSRSGITLPASPLPSWTAFQGPRALILVVMVSVLLPGIIEELMFRGVVQGSMESEGGQFSAIFLQAFAFAIFHADPLFILAPFLAGMLLGFVRKTTGSIYSSVLTHMSLNLTILLMQPILPRITSEYFDAVPSLQILYSSLLAACVAAVALIPMVLVFSSLSREKTRVKEKLVFFPADWKFILACLVLISTLLFVYFTNS